MTAAITWTKGSISAMLRNMPKRRERTGLRPERRQDPRVTAARITAVGGEPVSEETWALVMSPVRLTDGEVMLIPAPQVVAFNLIVATRRAAKGVRARKKLEANLTRGKDGNLRARDPRKVMDCLEELTSSVLYGYAALEGFGNHYVDLLPPTATVTVKRRDKDITVEQPEMVERLSVGQKVDRVVPLVTGRPSLRGQALWREFVALKRLRDAVVHPKERGSSADADEPGIYAMLMRGDGDAAAANAVALVEAADPQFLQPYVREGLGVSPDVSRTADN